MNLTYLEIDRKRSIYQDVVESHGLEFRDRLAMSWLYHDHALEGVVIAPEDLERARQGMPARNYCDGVLLHSLQAMREAIDLIHDSAYRGDELSIDWLRDLHEHLSLDDSEAAGRYRQRDTSPGVYHLDVVPQNSISYHFHKFIDSFHGEMSSMHPVRRAAVAHWEFMCVFPFDHLTGVVGRLMANFVLLRHGFPPAIIHATDRQSYFDALKAQRIDGVPVIANAVRSSISAAREYRSRFGAERPARRTALYG